MTLYFDSSALVKLVREEVESAALEEFVGRHEGELRTTSALARTELVRAMVGMGAAAVADARLLLSGTNQLPITGELLDAAADLPTAPRLRSLDAIHIATARTVPDLRALITYDDRMRASAEALGLPVVSPS